jgi:hypothetical protein
VAGFMRLPLQRNVQQGLKKLADIQEGWFYEGFQDENIVLDIL